MVTFVGTFNGWPATLEINIDAWHPVEVGKGRWAITNGGRYIGSYMRKDLADNECFRRNGKSRGTHVTFDTRTNKFMANIPGEGFYGRYDTAAEAHEAIAMRRNIAAEKKRNEPVTLPTPRRYASGNYRVMVEGKFYGTYQSQGHAILLRDFVHHMLGKPKQFSDYLMPFALVSNAVARSLIKERVEPATDDQLREYVRRVDEINGTSVGEPVRPPDLSRMEAEALDEDRKAQG